MASDTLYGVHMLFDSGPESLGDGYSAQSLKNYIDEAIKVGSDVIRFPGDWNALEPAPGQWNNDYVNNVREAVQYAGENGVQVVMLFAQTPQWARPNPDDSIWHPPVNSGDFANAMAYFYNQLAGVNDNVVAWEVWNEPNVFEFWGSADPSTDVRQVDGQDAFVLVDTSFAAEYVNLLNASYAALHAAASAANTNVTVLGGSTAGTDFQYVQAMIAAGAQFDGLSVHPYTRVNDTPGATGYGTPWIPDATEAQLNSSARPTLNKLWSFEYGMNQIRDLVGEDVWITEFGWSLGDEWGEVSSSTRAQYMERAFQLIQEWEDVPAAIAYRLFDDGAGDFGILNDDGSIRESGLVLKDYADGNVGNGGGDPLIQGTLGDDDLLGTASDDQFAAEAGNDILRGQGGNDFYLGGTGQDQFVFSAGADFVGDFNLQDDRVVLLDLGISSFAQVQLLLQQWGPNAAIAIDSENWIVLENTNIADLTPVHFGFSDPDAIVGTEGNDVLLGTTGSDTLQALGGNDELYAGDGDDQLEGGSGNDLLFGNAGSDNLAGGEGDDFLLGGSGNDQFTFAGSFGKDFIGDFSTGDTVVLSNTGVSSFTELQGLMSEFGGNTFIIFNGQTEIVLEGISTGSLSATDFVFS